MKTLNLNTLEIDGINFNDYPDFVDAYATYCEWSDGSELSERELNNIEPDIIYQAVLNSIF